MRFHFLSYFLRNPYILSLLECLVPLVLFMIFLLIVINCLHELLRFFFWYTRIWKRYRCYSMSLQTLLALTMCLSLQNQLIIVYNKCCDPLNYTYSSIWNICLYSHIFTITYRSWVSSLWYYLWALTFSSSKDCFYKYTWFN